jgi:hypothetical protein
MQLFHSTNELLQAGGVWTTFGVNPWDWQPEQLFPDMLFLPSDKSTPQLQLLQFPLFVNISIKAAWASIIKDIFTMIAFWLLCVCVREALQLCCWPMDTSSKQQRTDGESERERVGREVESCVWVYF